MEVDDAMAVLAALEREDVAYVLVGAVAMALAGRGESDAGPRPVRGLRRGECSAHPRGLDSVFSDPDLAEITSEELAGDYSVVRYVPPSEAYAIDLIARLGEAFAIEDLQWEVLHRDGVAIRVATPSTLYRMKRDTLRWKDAADAARLRERFGLEGD